MAIVSIFFGIICFALAFFAVFLRIIRRSSWLKRSLHAYIYDEFKLGASLDKAVAAGKKKLLAEVRPYGKILDCGSANGMSLKYLASIPAVREIICLEPNDKYIPELQERVKALKSDAKIKIAHSTLQKYLYDNVELVGTFDAVVCFHSLSCLPETKAMGKLIQVALKKNGKLIFLEPTLASKNGWTRFLQRLLRIPIVLITGYDVGGDIIHDLSKLGWKSMKTERFTATKDAPSLFRPQVMGYCVAAVSKGGLR
mmetsp:Transcript_13782/g.20803  ORF Transcript_13782/g.20803 Transcript_13782/m.20803 type:complete len:255 (+) Transcript_13782:88-852(+)